MTNTPSDDPKNATPENDPGLDAASEGDLKAAEDIVVMVETGPREPVSKIAGGIIIALCVLWSCFQLMYAESPAGFEIESLGIDFSLDSFKARSWHLAFALALAFLAYPAFKENEPGFITKGIRMVLPSFGTKRSNREYVPFYDWILAAAAASLALYIWYNYDDAIVMRGGLAEDFEIWLGIGLILLLLEAARRSLGPALSIIAAVFLAYNLLGNYMPEFLRHSANNIYLVIPDQYLATNGIFGVPLKVSTEFVFLFVLFGAFLEKAGAGKYFIDVAYSIMGGFTGGPAKAAVLASGMNGMVSGSSIANTVTTGTFTIPLMKKVGLPPHKAGAVEVAASTNGQLMPPIMGAAAFIMAEILGIPYIDVVRAAFIPAVISYIALIYVVHLEAMKLGLRKIPRSELPPFLSTFLRGIHYLIPVIVLITYLVVLQRSAIYSCLLAIESVAVIMILQRPILAWLGLGVAKSNGALDPNTDLGATLWHAFIQGILDIWQGLIQGARNMISVGVATATAGIVVGVVTSTGLAGRFVTVIDTLSFGNIYIALVMTALVSMFLGMGLPTTANYILMASLTAPVIVQLGADAGLIFPVLAAHLFVFYFGILADDTPPVGLAAYAAAAIAKTDPIKTGIQGFTYDLRTAILPFVFLLNIELLTMSGVEENGSPIWMENYALIAWIFFVSLLAMFAFAAALQGFFGDRCSIPERLALGLICVILFRPGLITDYVPISRYIVQAVGVGAYFALYFLQTGRRKRREAEAKPA
ncbi:MAG: TRAP transporter permease [Magnetospiraceae bacterium]